MEDMHHNLLEGLQPGGAAWHRAVLTQRERASEDSSAPPSPAGVSRGSSSEVHLRARMKTKSSASTPGIGLGMQFHDNPNYQWTQPGAHRPVTVHPSAQNPRGNWRVSVKGAETVEGPGRRAHRPVTVHPSAQNPRVSAEGAETDEGPGRAKLPEGASDDVAQETRQAPKKLLVRPRRPITEQGKRTRTLSSFWRYTQQTKVEEAIAPSDLHSMAVPTAFELESDMSVEDLRAFISARPPPPQTARSERLSSAKRNELQDYLKRSQSQGSMSARSSSARALREATPSQFVSPGLLAHTSLERMAKLEGPYRSKRPEISRLAECCHLLECLSVKYFDQEVESIKEELFRCIFNNYDELCHVNRPRARGAFLDASPFFQLYEQEQQNNEKLQTELDSLKIKNQDLQFMNKGLKDRLQAATSSREENETNAGDPAAPRDRRPSVTQNRRPSFSQKQRPSTSQVHTRPPQVPELAFQRVPSASPSLVRGSRGIASAGGSWKTSMLDAHFPPTDAVALQNPGHPQKSPLLSRGHRASGLSEREPSRTKLVESAGSKTKLVESVASSPIDSRMKDNPFYTAAKGAQKMVSRIKDFEDFLGIYRNPSGGDEGGLASKVFAGLHKRRKHDHEARWHDFALFLSRHPECCIQSKQALQIAYHEWRESMGHKAPFSTMLRALIRHNQLRDTGIGDGDIEYSETIGQQLDESSDEEEDVEHLVQERDLQIQALKTSLFEAEKLRSSAEELHGHQLHERSEALEKHHEGVLRTAEKGHAKQVGELEERILELRRDRDLLQSELDAEIAKQQESQIQHLKQLQEQLEQEGKANKRLQNNNKELEAEINAGMDQIKDLQSKLDQGSAQRAELRKQLTDKHDHITNRMVKECIDRHAQELRETIDSYEKQLEIEREATRGPFKVSETRCAVVMDLFETLQAVVLNEIEEDPYLEETDSTLHTETSRNFAYYGQQLRMYMDVESRFDTDSDEEYHDPAIGPTTSHNTQTDIAPIDLNIAVEPDDGRKGKGKAKSAVKASKAKKNQAALIPPPPTTEEIMALHKVIDTIYRQKMNREVALADGSIEGIPWFAMRFWLGKFGSIELAMQEHARVKELTTRLKAVDDKATVFGRVMGFWGSPLPLEFGEFFLNLKREGYAADHETLRWTDAVIDNGLPAGSKGQGPQPLDGVLRVEIAKRLLRVLCYQFELREQPAWTEIEGGLIWDKQKEFEVCGVGEVMLAVFKQVDAKLQFLAEECDQHLQSFQGKASGNAKKAGGIVPMTREREVAKPGTRPLTMEECGTLVQQLVADLPVADVLSLFHFIADMCREETRADGATGRPGGVHFAAAVLSFLPRIQQRMDRVHDEKVGDNTFITTQVPASPELVGSEPPVRRTRRQSVVVELEGKGPVESLTMLEKISQPLDPEQIQELPPPPPPQPQPDD